MQELCPRNSRENTSNAGYCGSSDENSNSNDVEPGLATIELMDTSEEPEDITSRLAESKTGELPAAERMVAMMHLSESAPILLSSDSATSKRLSGQDFRFPEDFCDVFARFDQLGEEHQIHFVQEFLLRMNQYQHGEVNSYLKPLLKRDFLTLLSSRLFPNNVKCSLHAHAERYVAKGTAFWLLSPACKLDEFMALVVS